MHFGISPGFLRFIVQVSFCDIRTDFHTKHSLTAISEKSGATINTFSRNVTRLQRFTNSESDFSRHVIPEGDEKGGGRK